MRKLRMATGEWTQTSTTSVVRLLRCPDCDRLLRARGGSAAAPTFYCRRCHHTWPWLTHGARRIVLRVVHTSFAREREFRPLTRWRS